MALQAGKLNQRVALQSKANTIGAGGTLSEGWTTQATVWARVEAVAGIERVAGQQVEATTDYRITIRHRSDVTTKWQASHDSKTLAIKAVLDPDGRRTMLVLLCDEQDGEEGV